MYVFGSIPVLFYTISAQEVPFPPSGFLLITDGSNLLMTDGDPVLTAGA